MGDRVVVEMGRVVEDVENGGWKGGVHSILCLGCVCLYGVESLQVGAPSTKPRAED